MTTNDMLAISRAETLVESITAIGCKVPGELASALSLVQAVRAYPIERPPVEPVLDGATAANVTKRLDELIDARSRMAEVQTVKTEAVELATRRLRLARTKNTDAILAGCAEGFRSTAEEFTKLHAALPEAWRDAAAMLEDQGGIDTFRKAKALVPVLDMYRTVANTLIPVRGESVLHEVTRTVDLEHSAVAGPATRAAGHPSTLGRWGELLDVEGVKGFIWHESAREHLEYIKKLPEAPKQTVRNPYASPTRTAT